VKFYINNNGTSWGLWKTRFFPSYTVYITFLSVFQGIVEEAKKKNIPIVIDAVSHIFIVVASTHFCNGENTRERNWVWKEQIFGMCMRLITPKDTTNFIGNLLILEQVSSIVS
jgi:hypothetical protein